MECRRVCHVNGAAGHCRLVEGIPLLQLGEDVKGLKFKRQQPMGYYIVDFVCIEHKLIIELDGGHHQQQMEYDQQRTDWLNSQDYTVLRFWNHDVLQQIEVVLERIRLEITLSPALSLGERG